MSQKKAQEYLEINPNVKEVFFTTDGFIFLKESDAKNHSKTLGNKKINKIERKESIESKKIEGGKA